MLLQSEESKNLLVGEEGRRGERRSFCGLFLDFVLMPKKGMILLLQPNKSRYDLTIFWYVFGCFTVESWN